MKQISKKLKGGDEIEAKHDGMITMTLIGGVRKGICWSEPWIMVGGEELQSDAHFPVHQRLRFGALMDKVSLS